MTPDASSSPGSSVAAARAPRVRLLQFRASPYCRKARMALDYKGVAYETVEVGFLRREELERLSGQRKVPALDFGGEVVADSTAILRFLEARVPEPRLIPADAEARARAMVWEDWADEALIPTLAALRWLIPASRRRAMAEAREAYPARGLPRALALGVVSMALPALVRLRVLKDGGLPRHFALLDDALELLSDALAGPKCLCGDEPTAADLAVYSALSVIAGLEGWERVVRVPSVIAWYGRLAAWDAQPPFGR